MKKPEKLPAKIDLDVLEEVREVLINSLEEHSWVGVEEALEILNGELGYENNTESSDQEQLEE